MAHFGATSPESSTTGAFTCATCGRNYQRSSHLRPHELTHADATGFHCPFCEKLFARRDVCRKHALQCPSKGTREDPPLARRGQKPKACDACFRSRLACDNATPCSRCVARQLICSYQRLAVAATRPTTTTTPTTGVATAAATAAVVVEQHWQLQSSNTGNELPHRLQLPSPSVVPGSGGNTTTTSPSNSTSNSSSAASPEDGEHENNENGINDGGDDKIGASFLLNLTNPKAETMVGAFINEPGRDIGDAVEPVEDDGVVISLGIGGGLPSSASEDVGVIGLGVSDGFIDDLLTGSYSIFPWSLPPQAMVVDDDFGTGVVEDMAVPGLELMPTSGFGRSEPRIGGGGGGGSARVLPSSASLLPTTTNTRWYLGWDTAGLEAALAAIVVALQETHDFLAQNEPAASSTSTPYNNTDIGNNTATAAFNSELAAQLFVPANLRSFVSGYFRHTHHDFPTIHKASYSPGRAAPELTLAMFLCGSLYSPPTDSALSTRSFFHLAEELAFRRLAEAMAALAAAKGSMEGPYETTAGVHETLQAALVIHCLQFTMSSVSTRRRNRTVRLPALVSAVRTLGLTGTRHKAYSPAVSPAALWGEFILTETRIRIATWTVQADWQQSGMFHCPSLMTVLEMTADLPCMSQLWDAESAVQFERAVQDRGGPACMRRSASIRAGIEALMADPWNGLLSFPVLDLTIEDMQLFVFALHDTILTARFASVLPTCAPAIVRATTRWQELWDHTSRALTSEELSRRGLVRHSIELCWLARKTIEVFLSGAADDSDYLCGVAHDSLEELHSFLRRYCLLAR